MSAHDRYTVEASPELLHALERPLVSADNYLAGVRTRTHSLATHPVVPHELGAELLRGIHGALQHLEEAAAVIAAHGIPLEHGATPTTDLDDTRSTAGGGGAARGRGLSHTLMTAEEDH